MPTKLKATSPKFLRCDRLILLLWQYGHFLIVRWAGIPTIFVRRAAYVDRCFVCNFFFASSSNRTNPVQTTTTANRSNSVTCLWIKPLSDWMFTRSPFQSQTCLSTPLALASFCGYLPRGKGGLTHKAGAFLSRPAQR